MMTAYEAAEAATIEIRNLRNRIEDLREDWSPADAEDVLE